jgi:hypothetical protein
LFKLQVKTKESDIWDIFRFQTQIVNLGTIAHKTCEITKLSQLLISNFTCLSLIFIKLIMQTCEITKLSQLLIRLIVTQRVTNHA